MCENNVNIGLMWFDTSVLRIRRCHLHSYVAGLCQWQNVIFSTARRLIYGEVSIDILNKDNAFCFIKEILSLA